MHAPFFKLLKSKIDKIFLSFPSSGHLTPHPTIFPPPHAPLHRPIHPPRLSPHAPAHRCHCLVCGRYVSLRQRGLSFPGRVFGFCLGCDCDRGGAGDGQRQVHFGPGRRQDHSSYRRQAFPRLFGRAFFRSELDAYRSHDHIRTDFKLAAD